MEIWDVYDRNRNLTGKKVLRGEPNNLKKGEYGLVVHVAIFNQAGEMLIQKRKWGVKLPFFKNHIIFI